ncbi:MAG: hypothetical protein HYU88_13310 [Chloroflexi bacterium]|nr:hypothetical protein [Chloroflexota bacterium]
MAEGIKLLREALAAIESAGILAHQSLALAQLSEAYALADRLTEARGLAERALTSARERRERGYEAWALRALGAIASRSDPPDGGAAEDSYRRAVSLATDLGMRPLVAHCHLGLGRLHQRLGQRRQAHEHLTAATTMCREMDMRLWLERAETEILGAAGEAPPASRQRPRPTRAR